MSDPSSISKMTVVDVEKEVCDLKRLERVEQLRRLRARAGSTEQEPREGGRLGSESKRTIISDRILKPPNLEECSTYDVYKNKLQLWELGIDISKKQKAAKIILSLSNYSKFKKNLADKFLENHSPEDLASDKALDLVKNYLEKELSRPGINKAVEKWNGFEDCRKLSSETYEGYLDSFGESSLSDSVGDSSLSDSVGESSLSDSVEGSNLCVGYGDGVRDQQASKVQSPQIEMDRPFQILARTGNLGWVKEVTVMSKMDGDTDRVQVCEVEKDFALRCLSLEGGTAKAQADIWDHSLCGDDGLDGGEESLCVRGDSFCNGVADSNISVGDKNLSVGGDSLCVGGESLCVGGGCLCLGGDSLCVGGSSHCVVDNSPSAGASSLWVEDSSSGDGGSISNRFEKPCQLVQLASKIKPPQQIKFLARTVIRVKSAVNMPQVDVGKKSTDQVCEVDNNCALRCPCPEGGTAEADMRDSCFSSSEGDSSGLIRSGAAAVSAVFGTATAVSAVVGTVTAVSAVVKTATVSAAVGATEVSAVVGGSSTLSSGEDGSNLSGGGDSSGLSGGDNGHCVGSLDLYTRNTNEKKLFSDISDATYEEKEEVGESLGEREAVETIAFEDTGSPDDEDVGERQEEITVDGEEIHDWNTVESRTNDKDTQLLRDVPEATDEEGSNEADYASSIISPLDPAGSFSSSLGSTVPGPSLQGGLGVEGVVGTTTLSGPIPLRGAGVPGRRACDVELSAATVSAVAVAETVPAVMGAAAAVETTPTEDIESPEDEDMGEMWEDVTIEGEEAHNWNTGEAIENNTQEVNNEADYASSTVSPFDSAASWPQSEASAIPSPSSQGGLGEEGGWVGTTTPSGLSPLRGSGVPIRRECGVGEEDVVVARDGHNDEDSPYVWGRHDVEDDHRIGSNVQVGNSLYEEGLMIGLSVGADDSAQAIAIIRRGIKQSDLWTFYKLEVLMGPADEKS